MPIINLKRFLLVIMNSFFTSKGKIMFGNYFHATDCILHEQNSSYIFSKIWKFYKLFDLLQVETYKRTNVQFFLVRIVQSQHILLITMSTVLILAGILSSNNLFFLAYAVDYIVVFPASNALFLINFLSDFCIFVFFCVMKLFGSKLNMLTFLRY